MILPDTSIWIEFFRGREPVLTALADLMEGGEVVAVEWVFGELLQGTRSVQERRVISSYWSNLPKVGAGPGGPGGIWIRAGIHSAEQGFLSRGVGLIDAAILLSAIEGGAQLWTLDKKLARVVPDALLFRG
ncbi:MAG: PIN domain-containing protein [Planctomycetes bacterium]|nr:PIN domain-containing protein [Planctomycetota bacterium]